MEHLAKYASSSEKTPISPLPLNTSAKMKVRLNQASVAHMTFNVVFCEEEWAHVPDRTILDSWHRDIDLDWQLYDPRACATLFENDECSNTSTIPSFATCDMLSKISSTCMLSCRSMWRLGRLRLTW